MYTHKSPHFHNNPLLAINPKGKTNIEKNLSASLPGFSQLWTALPRKTTLLRSCCKRISLQGKTQKHGPFHWIPMAFSCCLAVYFSRLSCRELSEPPCPSNTCCCKYSNIIMFKDKSNLSQATQIPETFLEQKKNTANISDSESYNALVCRALRTGQVEKSLVADIRESGDDSYFLTVICSGQDPPLHHPLLIII